MIVVIADDLTGAGEIGGIGLAYGLKVELQRGFCPETNAELLILDTDSRSLPPEEAGPVVRDIARRLKESDLPIEWIYKKTDSVLRGSVAGELEALREAVGVSRVLLVPANPSKGRVICNGNYLIHSMLLSETEFANDPEYPARTSRVLELPGLSGSGQIHLLTSDQRFPCEGIMIGQAETPEDLMQWSERMDEQMMMAGAGEFFEAILRHKGFSKKRIMGENEYRLENKALFVCGSSSNSSRQALRQAEHPGRRVCRMPEKIFRSDCPEGSLFQQWSDEVIQNFENSHHVIIAIDREVVGGAGFAGKLRRFMARIVLSVLREIPLKELFVEGGATASEIVDCLGWHRFEPCEQLASGVVRMKVSECEDIFLTIKPGSYPWPKSIWEKKMFEA